MTLKGKKKKREKEKKNRKKTGSLDKTGGPLGDPMEGRNSLGREKGKRRKKFVQKLKTVHSGI